jgi:hypothetical protein
VAYFNDATPGVAASLEALERYAAKLGVTMPDAAGTKWLRDSGYMRLESGPFVVLFDSAPIGPDYQPGHAHADTLAFELSCDGARVLCNSGVSTYAVGIQRAFERSTRAHNTVVVDGANSSEVWASFRVARRARALDCVFELEGDGAHAAAAHDGYDRLPGAPRHWRELKVQPGRVCWTDSVEGGGEHEVAGYLPLHPGVRCDLEGRKFRLHLQGGSRLEGELRGDAALRLETGTFADGFNLRRDRPVLVWSRRGTLPCRIEVELRLNANPVSH